MFPTIPEFFIPFIFVLAVVYGSLQVAGIFKNKAVNLIIAIVFAFFAASTGFVSEFIYSIFPYAVLLFIIFFFLALVKKSILGRVGKGGPPDWTMWIVLAVLILLLLAAGQEFINDIISPLGISGESLLWIVGFIVIIGIFYMAYAMAHPKAAP